MTSTTSNRQLKKTQKVLLQQQIPFVSYRLPLEAQVVTLVQHHSLPEKVADLNLIEKDTGFLMAPFSQADGHPVWFLRPDCVFFGNDIEEIYIEKLAANNRFLELSFPECTLQTTTNEEYITNVAQAVTAMENGAFHKVVLSKVRIEQLPTDFDATDFFQKLCDIYAHAMVYMVQMPGVGCWVGATPEPLMVVENDWVKTVSLAGTQVSTGVELDSYQWSTKEIEEQGIVTGFVEETLQNLGVKDYQKKGPENYQAANLIHLKTSFEFSRSSLQGNLNIFLTALHPTPSVGGLPKKCAQAFILSHEQHDRSYYSGFLGPVNINEKTDLFVNLRCLQLFNEQFVLYSGAGITSSSEPLNEWVETDNKMLTMLNVIRTS